MPDLTMSVTISRTLLSLSPLELNDHVNYYAGPSSPGEVTWQKNYVGSPFVDDDILVSQRRGKVQEEMLFEVLAGTADTAASMRSNLSAIVAAFNQLAYTLTVTVDGQVNSWACDSANYQVIWSGPRLLAKQAQVRLLVPRSPIPLSGGF